MTRAHTAAAGALDLAGNVLTLVGNLLNTYGAYPTALPALIPSPQRQPVCTTQTTAQP